MIEMKCYTSFQGKMIKLFEPLKPQVTTVADDILNFFYYYLFKKIRLDISCELSARQTMCMECQGFFLTNSKKKKKIRMPSATILLGT